MRAVCSLVLLFSVVAFQLVAADGKAQVEFFVMSKCPDVQNFYKKIVSNLYTNLNDIMNITVNFIAKVDATQKYGFKSLHGVTEVEGDLIEVCTQKYYPQANAFLKLHLCLNPTMPYIPRNVKDCVEQIGFDLAKIQTCAFGEEGKALLTQSIQETEAKAVKWSPTMYLSGQKYCEFGGGGDCKPSTLNDFIRDICNAATIASKPVICPK
jgi:hypothetical protein